MKRQSTEQREVYIEFKESSVHVLAGDQGLDLPVERDAAGQLASGSREALANGLRGFLHRHSWSARQKVFCSIPARGVTFRAMSLPAPPREQVEHVLALQIETQFPLAPEELAWGYLRLPLESNPGTGEAPLDSFLVAAVKREIVQSYSALLTDLQLDPVFTIAGLARLSARNGLGAPCAILEAGETKGELSQRDQSGRVTLRVVSWGADQKINVDLLRGHLQANGHNPRLFLSGSNPELRRMASELASAIGHAVETLDETSGPGRTAANLGLRRQREGSPEISLLTLRTEGGKQTVGKRGDQWKWAAAAGILLLLLIGSRYLEPALRKSRLTRQLTELKAYRDGLPQIERELTFLEFIKTNQPPYLDAIYLLASSSPRGLKLESLTMGRRGDLSVRGMVNDPDGANELRARLVDSGFFSRVVVEEQTPEQNRRQVKFRISARIKPEGERKALPTVPTNSVTSKTPGRGRPMPPVPPRQRKS